MSTDLGHALLITLAGACAGFINAVVGSGTLISFPTLLALGYPITVANMTNNVGLLPASIAAAYVQRRDLRAVPIRKMPMAVCAALGGVIGGLLLLTLPSSIFAHIVPCLILLGVGLVLAGPTLQRRRHERKASLSMSNGSHMHVMNAAICAAGIYGGYFGAAQGVIVIGILGGMVDARLPLLNAAKNLSVGAVNLAAALVFVIHGGIVWWVAGLLALGAGLGGVLGGRVGRRISANVLRLAIAAVGITSAVLLLSK
jgi:uncharacterized membrane protein YfcA